MSQAVSFCEPNLASDHLHYPKSPTTASIYGPKFALTTKKDIYKVID